MGVAARSTNASVRAKTSWAPFGDETITNVGMILLGPSTFRVTDPPESRNNSKPVSNRLVAVSRRKYGNGFFGGSGNPVGAVGTALASGPVIVAVMPTACAGRGGAS
jgi:hypothetical protein